MYKNIKVEQILDFGGLAIDLNKLTFHWVSVARLFEFDLSGCQENQTFLVCLAFLSLHKQGSLLEICLKCL